MHSFSLLPQQNVNSPLQRNGQASLSLFVHLQRHIAARIGENNMMLTRFVTSTAIAAALILPRAAVFAQDSITSSLTIVRDNPTASGLLPTVPDVKRRE
jgi:hypothetical protein